MWFPEAQPGGPQLLLRPKAIPTLLASGVLAAGPHPSCSDPVRQGCFPEAWPEFGPISWSQGGGFGRGSKPSSPALMSLPELCLGPHRKLTLPTGHLNTHLPLSLTRGGVAAPPGLRWQTAQPTSEAGSSAPFPLTLDVGRCLPPTNQAGAAWCPPSRSGKTMPLNHGATSSLSHRLVRHLAAHCSCS